VEGPRICLAKYEVLEKLLEKFYSRQGRKSDEDNSPERKTALNEAARKGTKNGS